jgi:hypothetical protein
MKMYAFFFNLELVEGKPHFVRPCGDRSILSVDGRSFIKSSISAGDWAKRHKYDGYRLGRCNNLLDDIQWVNGNVVPVSAEARDALNAAHEDNAFIPIMD